MTRHLIHIGLPKAGSTYLASWFAAHPQLAYEAGALGGFRDVHAIGAAAVSSQPDIFWRVTSSEELSAPRLDAGSLRVRYQRGERATIAEEQARACGMLAELFRGATILIVTRGFRSAMLSAYSEFVRTGGTESLAEALRPPRRDYPWHYDKLVGFYRKAFGAERVILLPFELLRASPERFLQELERQLGLDPFAYSTAPANIGASPVELAWYGRLTAVAGRLGKPGGRFDRLYIRLLYRGRLAPFARIMQRLSPLNPVTADLIDDAFLEPFRGSAECLRDEPLYQPYLAEYLLEPPARAP